MIFQRLAVQFPISPLYLENTPPGPVFFLRWTGVLHFCTMKLISSTGWLARMLGRERKTENISLLQQQLLLLHEGYEGSAEVMEATLFENKVGSLFPVKLWIKLRKPDGSFIYTHTHSLVQGNHIACRGQQIRIKYIPENLSAILIL